VLGLFAFPEIPIYRGQPAGKGRWFYYYFFLLVIIYAGGALAIWLAPEQGLTMTVAVVTQLLSFVGLLVLIVLRLAAGREEMARVWLAWGSWRYWLLFGAAIVAYYVVQAALNAMTGLGGAALEPSFPIPTGINPTGYVILATAQSVLLSPFLAIVIAWGEEYGWRGYLQSELFKLGRVRGVLLLGVIWGLWHAPVILMGHNYPGHPYLGVLLMTLYTTGLAVVLGYAVLKARSVLLAAYLHALNNQVAGVLVILGYRPFDTAFSFLIGTYGIVTLAVVAWLILRDPIWRSQGSSLPGPGPGDV